jgi:chromosomal replication initiation ATPase DnaA
MTTFSPAIQQAIEDFANIDMPAIMRGEPIPPLGAHRAPKIPMTIADIKRAVSVATCVTVEQMDGDARDRETVHARWIAMDACSRLGKTSTQIGNAFGGRDHSTVLYGLGQLRTWREKDGEFRQLYEECQEELRRA